MFVIFGSEDCNSCGLAALTVSSVGREMRVALHSEKRKSLQLASVVSCERQTQKCADD